MSWYNFVAAFFAGAFFANFVPHFVKGVCGDRFPTPFSRPPGKGLSSPIVNTLWAVANLVVGFFLLRAGKVSITPMASITVFFAGVILMSVQLSLHFVHKHAE